MQTIAKLPVTVITGFLGSGKTTLISQLMQSSQTKRLAVIVNEFGDVGVDGEILKTALFPIALRKILSSLRMGVFAAQ